MKKLLPICLLGLTLGACSSGTASSSSDGTVSGTASIATDSGEITATVDKKDGKIDKVTIDEISDNSSKKDAGDSYGMKDASSIGKEWYQQVEYLENYIVENGIDAVKLDSEGYAEEADLLAGCTINLTSIMEAVDAADAKTE